MHMVLANKVELNWIKEEDIVIRGNSNSWGLSLKSRQDLGKIRTLLTRIHNLPLALEHINSFEQAIIDCASNLVSNSTLCKLCKCMYVNSLTHLFDKNFVKATVLQVDFTKYFFNDEIITPQFTVEIAEIFSHTFLENFREITKYLIWRKNFPILRG